MATGIDTRIGVLAIVACLASACIPSRNNPRDPSRAPEVRVKLVSLEPCGGGLPSDGWPVVGTASRGACLALDATDSEDPQGGTMHFTYSFLTTAGEPDVIIADDSLQRFMPIPVELLRARRLDQLVRFGVTAVDASGAKGSASTAVVLTNSPPSFGRPSTILLPEGGFPWARDQAMPILLDGRVPPDPDGDPLQYCWTTPESELFTCDFFEAVWPVSIAPAADRQYFHLVVSDGDLASEQRTFVVRVGPSPLWADGEGLRRFDETLRFEPQPPGAEHWLARGAGGEEWVLLHDPASGTVTIQEWPSLTSTGLEIALGGRSAELAIGTSLPLPGGGTRIWLAARTGSAPVLDLEAYDLDAAGTVLTFRGARTVNNTTLRMMSADFAGNVAVGGVSDPAVLELVSATVTSVWTIALAPGTTIEGGGPIPETSIFSVTASGGTAGNVIFVYELPPDGGPPQLNQILDGLGPLRQLEYFDYDQFWAANPSTGLTLYHRDTLTPLATFPDILDVKGSLRVDPGTGACHLATLSSLITVDVEGREQRHPIESGTPLVRFVDAEGRIAVDESGTDDLRISRTLDPEAIVSLIDLQPIRAERALADGGIWAVTSGPAIVHLAENGTTLEYLTELNVDTVGEVPLIAPFGVVDPDGRAGWFVDTLGASEVLYRVDFAAPRDAPERLPAIEIDRDLGYYPIGASGPTASNSFAWLWQPNGSNPRYATIDEAGVFTERLVLTNESTSDTGAVMSHVSNDLCVFSQVGASTTLKHRRVSPVGVVTSAGEISVTSGPMNLRSPFTSPTRDECGVVAGTGQTHLFVWGSDGALHTTHDDADPLVSMTAVADGVYWGTGSLDGLPDERILTRILVLGTSGVFARETFPLSLPGAPVFLP